MASSVNRIRNADFSDGKVSPRGWAWSASSGEFGWHREESDRRAEPCGVSITSGRATGSGFWSQVAVCKPGKFYRVEATVTCDLTTDAEGASTASSAGIVLAVQPIADDQAAGERRVTPALHRATKPIAIRTYYRVPDGIRRLRVFVGVVDARGRACVCHVRFIEILDPEETSHILAIPPPPHALPAPRVAQSVCICSAMAAERPITQLLAEHFGENHVTTCRPAEFRSEQVEADAVLLPDPEPPSSMRSLAGLMKLAAQHIVVIALPAFAKLSRGALNLRRIEQPDDPIAVKVNFANHVTRGFALHDVFSYAWPGRTIGSFVQNQFRRTAAQKAFCEKHGFVTLLNSMCDQDVTSDRPICLYKETSGGGLFVLDIEPAEAPTSTFGEPAPAMNFLLSALGRMESGLGQYVVPEEREHEFRDLLRDMSVRVAPFVVHDADLPISEVTEQLVAVGGDDHGFGLPLAPKPAIVVRSGLRSGDVESVYGAFLWFKQFVRMEPYRCPYAQQLASQYRLLWVPCAAPCDARNGWRRPDGPEVSGSIPYLEDDTEITLLVDIVSAPRGEVRVLLPARKSVYQRYIRWLPQVNGTFASGPLFTSSVSEGETFCDRDRFVWRPIRHGLHLDIDPDRFRSDVHRRVMNSGGHVVRIEVPGSDADFPAYSIHRTDTAATLLEHVIGLKYGLIAVNRTRLPVHIDGFSPVGAGEALIVDHRNPMLRVDASKVG